MKKYLFIFIFSFLNASDNETFLDEASRKVGTRTLSKIPVSKLGGASTRITTRFAGKYDDNEDNPNAFRDAFVESVIEVGLLSIAAKAHPIACVALFSSEIADIGSTHFENSRMPMTDHERYVVASSLADRAFDSIIPHPESTPRMLMLEAEETASQALKLTSAPAKLIHAVSRYSREVIGSGLDELEITDENIYRAAQKVHQTFKRAPEEIKKIYHNWLDKPTESEPRNVRHISQKITLLEDKSDEFVVNSEQTRQFVNQMFIEHVQDVESTFRRINERPKIGFHKINENAHETYHDAMLIGGTINDSFTGLQCVAQLAGFRDAHKIGAFGNAAGSLATNMCLMSLSSSQLSAMGMSVIHPYVGIATAICSLVGLLNSNDDDDNGLAEAFAAISRQLEVFYDHVMKRFDFLEQMLDEHHRKVMFAFFKLYQHQEDMRKQIVEMLQELKDNQVRIQGALTFMESSASQRHQATMGQFADLRLEKINKLVSDIDFNIRRGALTINRN